MFTLATQLISVHQTNSPCLVKGRPTSCPTASARWVAQVHAKRQRQIQIRIATPESEYISAWPDVRVAPIVSLAQGTEIRKSTIYRLLRRDRTLKDLSTLGKPHDGKEDTKTTLSCHEHSARSCRSKPLLNGPGAYYNDKTSVSAAHSPRVASPPATWTLLLIGPEPLSNQLTPKRRIATPQMTSSTYKKDTRNISRERPHVRTKPKSIRPTEVPRPRIELGTFRSSV